MCPQRLVELAAYAGEGLWWRVGVSAPVDDVDAALAGGLAALVHAVPVRAVHKAAVMTVRRVTSSASTANAPGVSGMSGGGPAAGLQLEVGEGTHCSCACVFCSFICMCVCV